MSDNLMQTLQPVLTQPTPAALIELQAALLALEADYSEAAGQALRVAGAFYTYLSELQSKLTARQYNEWASRLDIGAVGIVALENVVAGQPAGFWERLLLGGLGESLMVAASRQYIKAWDAETRLLHAEAAWLLFEELWRASARFQPDLPAAERREAIERLLAPARDPATPDADRALLLGCLFQMLLLTHLSAPWTDRQPGLVSSA